MSDGRIAALERSRRPAPKGNTRALVHGAQATLQLQPRAREIADDLRPLLPDLRPIDEPTLAVLALTLARIERGAEWLDRQPELVTGRAGRPWPLLDLMSRWESAAVRLIEKLAPRASESVQPGQALAAFLDRVAQEGES